MKALAYDSFYESSVRARDGVGVMGWAYGQNNNRREIGYGVQATCDLEGCETEIDRGLAYCCGGLDGTANAGMDDEVYCGGFFCDHHLLALPSKGGAHCQFVCPNCHARQVCPDCKGAAEVDGEPCETCDTFGYVAQRDGKVVSV